MQTGLNWTSVTYFFLGLTLAGWLSTQPVLAETAPVEDDAPTFEDTESDLTRQIKLFFHIGDTTRKLNMEESGINGLNDTAGQSVGRKQLLQLKKKYEQELSATPDQDTVWTSLGSVLEILGQEAQALSAYEKAVQINANNITARQAQDRLKRSHRIQVNTYYFFQHQKEYAPSIDHDLATWDEQAITVQVSKSWGRGKTIGLGWLESSIEQENELYGDVDFSIKRRAPFFQLSWPVLDDLAMAFRIRDEEFTNNDDSGFYKIDGTEHIVTGYLALTYRGAGYWFDMNYSREREPDPVYNAADQRSALNIEVKQLTGLSGGYGFAKNWEIGSSLYYEQYGSSRKDQWNPNIQLSYWSPGLPGSRISLGYGYYTEEDENIINLTTSYQWNPLERFQMRIEYQLEYSGNEDSWLNQGDIVVSWAIVDRLSLSIRTDYSQEYGGDNDTQFFTQASLNWSLW